MQFVELFTFEIKKKLLTLKPFINQMVNKANKIFTKAKYVPFLWHNYFQAINVYLNLCSSSHYCPSFAYSVLWSVALYNSNNFNRSVHGELPYLMLLFDTYLCFVLYLVICACSKKILGFKACN